MMTNKMEEIHVASKNGSDAAMSTDKRPFDDLILDRKGRPRDCNESQDVTSRKSVAANLQKHDGVDTIDDGTAATIPLANEVQLQILQNQQSHSVISLPGAYHIEGPRLAESSRELHGIPSDMNVEMRDVSALDAELVQADIEQAGAAMMSRPDPSRLPMTDLVDAKILPDKANGKKTRWVKSKVLCLVTCVVLSAAAIFLPIFIFMAPKGSYSESLGNPAASSSTGNQPFSPSLQQLSGQNAANSPFQDTLPKAVLHDIEDPTSSFYLANLWMLGDPNLDSYSPERQRQRFYLAMLYYASNGDQWLYRDHWMSYNTSECHWYSHSSLPKDSPYYYPNICNENESLTSLSLASNNLTGSLPLFPTVLIPQLRVFDIDDNSVGGAIPPVFSGPYIDIFIISNNDFSESWRTGDGIFDFRIRVLKTNGNHITTGFPNRDGFFLSMLNQSFEVWNATDNRLDGTVPTEIGLATKLAFFGRGDNDMIGTLPSELGLLTAIKHLDFGGNIRMNGTIPAELGQLTALTHLDIAGTAISGSIPMNLCAKVEKGTLEIQANCSLVDCCVQGNTHGRSG